MVHRPPFDVRGSWRGRSGSSRGAHSWASVTTRAIRDARGAMRVVQESRTRCAMFVVRRVLSVTEADRWDASADTMTRRPAAMAERGARVAERIAQVAERGAQVAERRAQVAERGAHVARGDVWVGGECEPATHGPARSAEDAERWAERDSKADAQASTRVPRASPPGETSANPVA